MAAEREHPAADAAAKGEQPADVARRLREGGDVPGDGAVDQLAAEIRAFARRLSDVEVRHLAHAVRRRAPVQLRYRSASGAVTVRVVSQLTLRGGYLYGWCHLRQDERFFALGSILTVATA
jgi:predicted DNA-binding transcriptional regulator YafY